MAHKTAISSDKEQSRAKKSNIEESAGHSTRPAGEFMRRSRSLHKRIKEMPVIAALIAEFIGTFLLVATVFTVQSQPLYVALALVGIVLVIGGASGAYVNPAMTVGAWVTRKISSLRAIGYIIAQVSGAVVAMTTLSTFLASVHPSSITGTTGQTLYHAATIASGKEWPIFFAELLGTAILAFGFASIARIKRASVTVAFTYGLAILVALLVAGWVTSMSIEESNAGLSFINPAVAIAAGGVKWSLWSIAIYIIAPAIGGVIGFVLQHFMKSQSSNCNCGCGCECCDMEG